MQKYFVLFSAFVLVGCYGSSDYDYLDGENAEQPIATEEIPGQKTQEELEKYRSEPEPIEEPEVKKPVIESIKQAPIEITTPKKIPQAWIDANKNELESIEILLGVALDARDPKKQFEALEKNIEGFDVVQQAFLTDSEFIVNFEVAGTYRWVYFPNKKGPPSFFQ